LCNVGAGSVEARYYSAFQTNSIRALKEYASNNDNK